MARNDASAYGRDIACVRDADPLFTEAVGLAVVEQDAIHRLTTDHVLGPGGDNWGYDTTRLLGLPQSKLNAYQPVLAAVLQRDERILAAQVRLIATTRRGLADLVMDVQCMTAAGSFQFVRSVLELTTASLEAQAT